MLGLNCGSSRQDPSNIAYTPSFYCSAIYGGPISTAGE
jgi:hypothetical protein